MLDKVIKEKGRRNQHPAKPILEISGLSHDEIREISKQPEWDSLTKDYYIINSDGGRIKVHNGKGVFK